MPFSGGTTSGGGGGGGSLPALADGKIWVGNGSAVATARTVSGDGALSDTGGLTVLSAAGAFSLAGTLTPTALSGDVDDYNPTGLSAASVLRIDGGAADRNITGLAGGADGRILIVINIGATNNLVLKSLSSSSSAANRFQLVETTLGTNTAIILRYDGVSSVWRSMGRALGNSGATAGTYGGTAGSPSLTVDVQGRVTAASTATLGVPGGGTGVATLAAHGVLLGEGASNVAATAAGTSGQLLIGQGSTVDPAFETVSGDGTMSSAGALAITALNGKAVAASTGTDFDFSGSTNALRQPSGTTGQRPGAPVAGQQRYNSTFPARESYGGPNTTWRAYGGSYVLYQSGDASTHQTTSATEANIVAIKIPGGMLNANGSLRITAVWKMTASSNTKATAYRWGASGITSGGSLGGQSSASTTVTINHIFNAFNTNSTGAQNTVAPATALGTSTSAVASTSVDTTADSFLNINGSVAAGETLTLAFAMIELLAG